MLVPLQRLPRFPRTTLFRRKCHSSSVTRKFPITLVGKIHRYQRHISALKQPQQVTTLTATKPETMSSSAEDSDGPSPRGDKIRLLNVYDAVAGQSRPTHPPYLPLTNSFQDAQTSTMTLSTSAMNPVPESDALPPPPTSSSPPKKSSSDGRTRPSALPKPTSTGPTRTCPMAGETCSPPATCSSQSTTTPAGTTRP